MRHLNTYRLLATLLCTFAFATIAGEDYKYGPDSEEQPDVPKGTVKDFKWTESKIYPGTTRNYWIYLPPNFNAETEYRLMIFQDGSGAVGIKSGYRANVVFDNLIHKKEIPPLVGLFINPGEVPAVNPAARSRSTRSFEYDTPDDTYARFLIEEMIPEVQKHAKISANPEHRAVFGISSGGICAFNAAWWRPDAFRKVGSNIGSFTNIRGAYWFDSAIRKTERKPLRVFLQEGSNDLDNVHGNWPLGNQDLYAALKFAGYDVKFVMGDGGHSGKHGGTILPDTLRWLWREDATLPAPVNEVPADMALSGLLIPGEEWKVAVDDKKFVDAPCTDAEGNFYFSDLGGGGGLFKIALDGTVSVFNKDAVGISGMKFGPDGKLYACQNKTKKIVSYDKDGKEETLVTDVGCNDMAINSKGHIYFTETGKKQVNLVEGPGKMRVVDTGIPAPNGITLNASQETLAVSDYSGTAVYAMRVEADGSLSAKMPVMPFRNFGKVEGKGDGMCSDTRGRWYCATATGIQVYDPNGRPVGLVLSPTGGAVTSCALAGEGHGYLFALVGGKIFKRKVNAKGFLASAAPIYPEKK